MDVVVEVLSDQNFIGAILSCLVFILLGFLFARFHIFPENTKKVLNVLVLKIAIPCMAFCAFMSDFQEADFASNILIFVFDLFFYVLFIGVLNLCFHKFGREKANIYALLSSVGQLTLYSMPVLEAVYGADSGVLIPTSLMSLAFRLTVYLYGYITITGEKMTKATAGKTIAKVFLNPVMIAMFVGFLIWITQNVCFQVEVGEESYSFLRIDKTCPALYAVFQFGHKLATPLAMLMMGVSLGDANFAAAFKNGLAWLISSLRMFILPAIILGFCFLFQLWGWIDFSEIQLAAMVIGNAAPVGAILVAFCIDSDKEAYLASDSVLLSTILSVISMPTFFVLVRLSMTAPIFA